MTTQNINREPHSKLVVSWWEAMEEGKYDAMSSLVAMVLTAAPLLVRVLEHERPVRVRLSASEVSCDGAPLKSPVEIVTGLRQLEVGRITCGAITAAGDVGVEVDGETHQYAGLVRVTVAGAGIELVNELDVEDYLPSVVAAEVSGAKAAVLQAQAVIARTFALASRRRHGVAGYELCDASHCQVYRGRRAESAEAKAAVAETRGQVLLTGAVALRPAFSHASCGGHTSRAEDVFGEQGAGTAVADVDKGGARCREAPDFKWDFVVPREDLAEGLGLRPDGTAVEVLRRDSAGRVIELRVFGTRMTGEELLARMSRVFGPRSVPSTKLTVEEVEAQVHFTGSGRGHGVGLCQAGAAVLAREGADWKAILRRYFPDARIAPAP